MNPLLNKPTSDFNAIRDGRNSLPLYIDVDLTNARSIAANSALVLNIAGNSFFTDADTANGGNATVHFQDTALGNTSAPFFVSPGFIANVGFTQLLIENTAQAGKRLRIFYGVDIDFQAGVNSSIAISGSVSVADYPTTNFTSDTFTVTNVSQLFLAMNLNYLLVQNNHATGNIFLSFGSPATLTNGVKIGPGGSYEITGHRTSTSIYAIGDIASNTAVVRNRGA